MKNTLINCKIKGTESYFEFYTNQDGKDYLYGWTITYKGKKYGSHTPLKLTHTVEFTVALVMLQAMETIIELTKNDHLR